MSVDRERRRDAGAFYTPAPLAAALAQAVLGRMVDRTGEELRIVDPACGEGALLLAACEWLVAQDGRRDRRALVLGSIFGVDVDPEAVARTRRALAGFAGIAEAELVENIRCGDAVLGADAPPALGRPLVWAEAFPRVFAAGGFSAVLANPPFVDAERMARQSPALRGYCVRRYAAARGNWDLFCVFVELGLTLCAPGGLCGMIVPNKLASAGYAAGARGVLAREGRLVCVQDHSAGGGFAADVYPLVFVAERGAGPGEGVVCERVATGADGAIAVVERREVAAAAFAEPARPWPLAGGEDRLVAALRAAGRPLGEVAEVWGAATVAEAYAIAELVREDAGGLRVVNSGTIDRYEDRWARAPLRYLGRRVARPGIAEDALGKLPARRLQQARTPKVIVSGMTRVLEAILDRRGEVLAGKSTTIAWWEGRDLRLLVALLNSRLVSGYYRRVFGGDALARGYLRVGPPQLRQVPVFDPLAPGSAWARPIVEQIGALVDAIAADGLDAARDAAIERLVARLYGLSADEAAALAADGR